MPLMPRVTPVLMFCYATIITLITLLIRRYAVRRAAAAAAVMMIRVDYAIFDTMALLPRYDMLP